MSKVLDNRPIGGDFWLMRAETRDASAPGQFYMLRAWDRYPVLSRPVSVFDTDGQSVSFLYKVVGRGTALLAALRPGDALTLDGPHGTGWPNVRGRVALVGGGVGIAPLYLAAKGLMAGGSTVHLYLGFSAQVLLEQAYAAVGHRLVTQSGGFITDAVAVADYDHILTCGPHPMMEALHKKCQAHGVAQRLWVSLENRMACGIGACLVCTCKTAQGNRKACTDGPVFKGEAVFGV